jgi:hypothetical protein
MALIGAYWLVVLLFLLFAFGVSMMAGARARAAGRGFGPVLGFGLVPSVVGLGAAVTIHPGFSLLMTAAAILFSLWWLSNMAKHE